MGAVRAIRRIARERHRDGAEPYQLDAVPSSAIRVPTLVIQHADATGFNRPR
jgi:hypothetical protein